MGHNRRCRELSPREQKMAEALIREVCFSPGTGIRRADVARAYYGLGWCCFLEVYRGQPASFCGNGSRGWDAFILQFFEALLEEKAARDNAQYKETSLDAPVSSESDICRIELLGHKQGDFQNGILLQCYLEDLGKRSWDAARLGRCFIDGDTLEEAALVNGWTPERAHRAFNTLRDAMEEYRSI